MHGFFKIYNVGDTQVQLYLCIEKVLVYLLSHFAPLGGFLRKKIYRRVINREIYSYHCFKDLFVNFFFQYLLHFFLEKMMSDEYC